MKKSILIVIISITLGVILGLCIIKPWSREDEPEDSTATESSSEPEPVLENDPEPEQMGIRYVDSDGNGYKVVLLTILKKCKSYSKTLRLVKYHV